MEKDFFCGLDTKSNERRRKFLTTQQNIRQLKKYEISFNYPFRSLHTLDIWVRLMLLTRPICIVSEMACAHLPSHSSSRSFAFVSFFIVSPLHHSHTRAAAAAKHAIVDEEEGKKKQERSSEAIKNIFMSFILSKMVFMLCFEWFERHIARSWSEASWFKMCGRPEVVIQASLDLIEESQRFTCKMSTLWS